MTRKKKTYLALGDSYTIGEGLSASGRWPVILAERLRTAIEISTPHIIAATSWSTDELKSAIDEAELAESYDLVSLSIGVNNQYRGRSTEEFKSEFEALLKKAISLADGEARQVFVVSIPDWARTPFASDHDQKQISESIDHFNAIKQAICQKHDVLFVDITELTRAKSSEPSFLADDGLHYSAVMHHQWVERILEARAHNIAAQRDKEDELAGFANRFFHEEQTIYLDGNSLGKLPKSTATVLSDTIHREWGQRLIRSWNESWLQQWNDLARKVAQLIGAQPGEVFVGSSTSVNMYKLAYAALRLQGAKRNRIVTDALNFPTDRYILQGLTEHPFSDHEVAIAKSHDGQTITIDALQKVIDEQTALVTLSDVAYQSAFRYDMKAVNQLAQERGALTLWDLSHAVGAVPIDLNGTKADLAVGCTYKYLNGGPGAPAFLYVRKELQDELQNPIQGWLGHADPFAFDEIYQPDKGIQKFGVGTPHVLSMAALGPALDISLEAGMDRVRKKSLAQIAFMIELIDLHLSPLGFELASPRNPDQRGSHIALYHAEGYRITQALIHPNKEITKSIIPDFRPPGLIRIGIAPLYNSFEQLACTIFRLRDIVTGKEFESFNTERKGVS